jgi:hypothetical protein
MPRLRSLDVVPKPLPPPQLCGDCISLRQDWLDIVRKAARGRLKFVNPEQIQLLADAEIEAFRRYVAGRRNCKACNRGFTELGILLEPIR